MRKMTTSKIKLGIVACILLIFSQKGLSIKAIGTIPVKLCAEDLLILFQHMDISLCSVINDTHLLLHNTTRDKTNVQLGEICVTDEQCYNSDDGQKCLKKHCSCKDGCIEYNIKCIRGISYGENCLYSEQCNFYGGVCSRNHECSCSFGHVYDARGKTCHQGFIISSLICLCHLQLSLTIKAIGSTRERLCSEDLVALLYYLQEAPCKVTNETHVTLHDAIEDLENCLITCEINVEVSMNLDKSSQDTCVQQNKCPVAFGSTIESNSINVHKEFTFCCQESKVSAIVRGKCNYTLYKMDNLHLGERCISDFQCQSPITSCIMSRCSCMPDFVEYDGRCISDETFEIMMINKTFRSHGKECRYHFQCSYYGGVCSTTCSCISGHFFYKNRCIEVKQLGDSCNIDDQCQRTSFLMACRGNRCSCTHGYQEIDNKCVEENSLSLQMDNRCDTENQCEKTADWLTCLDNRCTCKMGYIRLQNVCLKTAVELQKSCRISLQCTGTSDANICHRGKCVCDFGFVQVENYCQRTESQQEMKSLTNNNVTAPAVGAGVSGLVIGALLGILIMSLIQRRRSSPDKGIKKSSSGNDLEAYETTLPSKSVSDRDAYDELGNVKKENTNVHTTNKGGSLYSVIEPNTEPKDDAENKPPDDVGVYNHLFEKDDEDDKDNYDNPRTVLAAQQEQKLEIDNTGSDLILSNDRKDSNYSGQDENNVNNDGDNYFVLEKELKKAI